MRSMIGLAVAIALSPLASGQKLSFSANEAPINCGGPGGATWHALMVPYRSNVSAIEFFLTSAVPTNAAVSVWDQDPATGKPRNMLSSGTSGRFFVLPGIGGYWGASFNPPVAVPPAPVMFVAVSYDSQGQAATCGSMTTPRFMWNPSTGQWSGPFPNEGWSYRVYSGSHAGTVTSFGMAKPGFMNLPPNFEPVGWPNTGNPFGLRVMFTAISAPCAFLLGPRTATPVLPLGTLYVQPQVSIARITLQSVQGVYGGYSELGVMIPNDPSLSGAVLAAQAIILDPAAAFGLGHTAGLELRIGH